MRYDSVLVAQTQLLCAFACFASVSQSLANYFSACPQIFEDSVALCSSWSLTLSHQHPVTAEIAAQARTCTAVHQNDASPRLAAAVGRARRQRRRREPLLKQGAGLRLIKTKTESCKFQRHGRWPVSTGQDDNVQHALRRLAGELSFPRKEENKKGDAARGCE